MISLYRDVILLPNSSHCYISRHPHEEFFAPSLPHLLAPRTLICFLLIRYVGIHYAAQAVRELPILITWPAQIPAFPLICATTCVTRWLSPPAHDSRLLAIIFISTTRLCAGWSKHPFRTHGISSTKKENPGNIAEEKKSWAFQVGWHSSSEYSICTHFTT